MGAHRHRRICFCVPLLTRLFAITAFRLPLSSPRKPRRYAGKRGLRAAAFFRLLPHIGGQMLEIARV